MSRWRCNAIYPGSYLEDGRMVGPGQEFEVPNDTPAREMWLPLDQPARDAVERAKAATDKYFKEQAVEAGRPSQPRRFKTAPDRMDHSKKPGERPDKDEVVPSARKPL